MNIFKASLLLLILLSSFAIASEKRFSIEKIDNQTILLNSETGETWRLVGDMWESIPFDDFDFEEFLIPLDDEQKEDVPSKD
jgi:hypothetical protein